MSGSGTSGPKITLSYVKTRFLGQEVPEPLMRVFPKYAKKYYRVGGMGVYLECPVKSVYRPIKNNIAIDSNFHSFVVGNWYYGNKHTNPKRNVLKASS